MESDHVMHHNVDLYSSEDQDKYENYEQHELDQDFKVYTVEDATRKIEAETKSMLQESSKKSSVQNSSLNTSPMKSVTPKNEFKPKVVIEEGKNTPVKNPKNLKKTENPNKYNAPVIKTKLDSVNFSDIVNYESNDDLISLTGDRKFMKGGQFGRKLNSNSSNMSEQQPKFSAFARPSTMSEQVEEIAKPEINMVKPEVIKQEIEYVKMNTTPLNRESDFVVIGDSSVATSMVSNIVKPKTYHEESKKEDTNLDYHKRVMNAHVPKANINIYQEPNVQQQRVSPIKKNNQHFLQEQQYLRELEELKNTTQLNTIKEVTQSGETISSGPKNQPASPTKQASSDSKATPSKKSQFNLQESLTDFVTFDEPPVNPKSPKKQAQTQRESSKANEEKKKKLAQKRKLEK